MWFILGIILWVLVAFWPALVARKKGHSFILFFLLSLVFFFASLILAYLVKDKNQTAADKRADRAAQAALDKDERAA